MKKTFSILVAISQAEKIGGVRVANNEDTQWRWRGQMIARHGSFYYDILELVDL